MRDRSKPRRARLVLALAVVALCALTALPSTQAAPAAPAVRVAALDTLEDAVLARINATRRSKGLKPLREVKGLDRAATAHARAMLRNGFFSHTSADGTSASTRIRRFYGGSSVGETILWRSPDCTAGEALQMWLSSPPHRAILLSSGLRDIGLAAVHGTAGGVFGGRSVTIVVADFGAP
jgi:uncharacterized protein YkwD